MVKLSLQKLPHYVFSSNRQFEKDERHICRIYDMSVLILMRKGILRFNENGNPIELKRGEYYIQRPNILQEGAVPSDQPNYYFIHFNGHYSSDGSLPLRGTFNIDEIQKIVEKFDNLKDSSEKIEKEILFYEILTSLKNSIGYKTTSEKIHDYILDNYNNARNRSVPENTDGYVVINSNNQSCIDNINIYDYFDVKYKNTYIFIKFCNAINVLLFLVFRLF